MAAIVSLRGISRSYVRSAQRLEVLKEVDLEIDAGEFVALLGPPGSGKTTLLNLISGFDRPDSGAIFVAGERIDTLSPRQLAAWCTRHVGLVLQSGHLLPMLSAERNVEIPLLMTPLSRYELRRNARAALDLVGLAHRTEHVAGELSGGEQQRVAIARALVADPAILLCDEPTGDLDRSVAAEVLQLLRNLNERFGTTIVMVTHDPWAAQSASRILRIDNGKLIAAAPAARVAA
jgi:putative ABC transport system ATP-binding protein